MLIGNNDATPTIRPPGVVAAYRQASPVNNGGQPIPASRGFGAIQDIVDLSPAALAKLNGESDPADTPADPAKPTDDAKAADPAVSDPFRAYRDADGNLSLEAAMQLEMLPPHLRKAASLMREATSLRDEINKTAQDSPADSEKLAGLQKEYAAAQGALWEELDKLGLTKKMKEQNLDMDDLLNRGMDGLSALDSAGQSPSTPKIADERNIAGLKELDRKTAPSSSSLLDWAFNGLKK